MQSTQLPRKLAIFGGTFDPVHFGHIQIARWACENLNLPQLFFVPNKLHPFEKRENISTTENRLKMLQLATANYPQFKIDLVEIEREGISYSVDTLKYFKEKYPQADLYFLIGSDNLDVFDKWKDPESILELATVLVYKRHPFNLNSTSSFFNRVKILDNPLINISSTDIRKKLQNGESCTGLIPEDVLEYIKKNRLYLE